MRHNWLATGILILAGSLVGCTNSLDPNDEEVYDAALTGTAEVPPKTTDARGQADFTFEEPDEELEFELSVQDIENVTMAHIHFAPQGVNGPIIVTLFQTSNPVTVTTSSTIASGEITEADIEAVTGFAGTFDALLDAMRSGNAYVNVHTQQNPAGEIRGQITQIL